MREVDEKQEISLLWPKEQHKIESHLYLFLFQSYSCFCIYLLTTIVYVGTGDKIVHLN